MSTAAPIRPGQHQSPVVDSLWASRDMLHNPPDPKPEPRFDAKGRLLRTPEDSKVELKYEFSTDALLQDKYTNPWGKIRVGRALEDLDAVAGTVALQHCLDADFKRPDNLLLVTAAVERITVQRQHARMDQDMHMTGVATFVGRSSIEIRITSQFEGAAFPWISATFTFVAREAVGNGAHLIPGLEPQSEDQEAAFVAGERRSKARRLMRQRTSGGQAAKAAAKEWADVPGNIPDPRAKAKDLVAAAQPLLNMPAVVQGRQVLMSQTRLRNALVCQPQQRNTAGRVFGGFLMRRAYELAFATAYLFGGTKPHFVEVDEVVFEKGVDVGDMLQLASCVLYTDTYAGQAHIHVEVEAFITRPEARTSERSNSFAFTFVMDDGMEVAEVLPATAEEARRVVKRMQGDALQRHFDTHYGEEDQPYKW